MLSRIITITLLISSLFGGIVAAELIYIDDVGPRTIGESFALTGSAELPAGTVLHIRVIPVADLGISVSPGPSDVMIWGDTVIEPGPSEKIGLWNYTINTSNLLPTAYFVRVYSDDMKYPYAERATAFIACSPTQTVPAQTQGFGIIGCLAGACAAVLLCCRWKPSQKIPKNVGR